MSKFEHALFIVLLVLTATASVVNYMIDNTQASIWALMATMWTFNYYMLKRKVS